MSKIQYIFFFVLLLPVSLFAQVVPFDAVRSALNGRSEVRIADDVLIEGYVINSQGNPNLIHNPQHATRYTEVNLKNVRKVM